MVMLSSPEPFFVDKLSPEVVGRALDGLGPLADVVVMDSPPLTEVADALAFADVAEATVITVRLGRSRRDRLRELRRLLMQHGVSPAGFVVTTRDRPRSKGYYYSRGAFVEPLPGLEEPGTEPEAVEGATKR